MIDHPQSILDIFGERRIRRGRALDHDDLDAKNAGRLDLGIGCASPAVLGDDRFYTVRLQKRDFVFGRERPAGKDVVGRRNGERRLYRIDASDEIMVLGRGIGMEGFLSSDRQEDTARGVAERGDRLFDRGDAGPAVAVDRLPARTLEPEQRHGAILCRYPGVCGNAAGKGMGRIHEKVDFLTRKPGCKTARAAEASRSDRHGLRRRLDRAPGQGERDIEIGARGQAACEIAGLGRSAQYEDVSLVQT